MKVATATLMAALCVAPAWAQSDGANLAEAEVRKVDKEQKKLTLKHGEIRNLDMPPMTMVFQVKDAALLDKLKAGDRIRFAAEKVPGDYAVTEIRSGP
jgi:Cu/Ag efflux protein CusF